MEIGCPPVHRRPLMPEEPRANPAADFRRALVRRKPVVLFVKRLLDVAVAAVLLIPALPLLLAAMAAVRMTSPGPVFFLQKRLGICGRIFTVLKLRTMVDGAWRQGLSVTQGDSRITPVGAFLRATHIDELPQLLNVLFGDMSLVGPRPALPFHFDYYREWEFERLAVRPGITGRAQVELGNGVPWDTRIEADVAYVRDISLWTDARILFATAGNVVSKALGRTSTYQTEGVRLWTRGFPDDLFTNRLYRGEQ